MLHASKSVPSHRSVITSIADAVLTSLDTREVLLTATELIGQAFHASRCLASLSDQNNQTTFLPVEWSVGVPDPSLDDHTVQLALGLRSILNEQRELLVVDSTAAEPRLGHLLEPLEALGISSLVALPTRFRGVTNGMILLHQCGDSRRWKDWEIQALEEIAYFVGVALYHTSQAGEGAPRTTQRARPSFDEDLALAHCSSSGILETVSDGYASLLEVAVDEVRGMHYEAVLERFVHPEDAPAVIRRYRLALEQGTAPKPFRYRIASFGGEQKWVVDQLTIRSDSDGSFIGVLSSLADVSSWSLEIEQLQRSEERYRRLVENSDAIIFHTDASHMISFISKRAMDFFGIAPEDFVTRRSVSWLELVHPEDRDRVEILVQEMQLTGTSFDEEFRVINRITGQVRWLLTRLMPIRDQDGDLIGWDGFGIDITGRREAQEALVVQSKKVRALYTVSSAIRGYLDPAHIASRGLHALCDATSADAGLCFLFTGAERKELSLVAHHGFDDSVAGQLEEITNLPNLSSFVATHGQPVVVPDMRNDPRASVFLAEQEGVRSAVLVPISVEDDILGTLALFSRSVARFDGGDVMLASAASNQIGLAARQADLFAAYKQQARKLSALYRTSHELSQKLSLDDIFLQAFTIIRDELGLKRLWLGLLNEMNTRLVGQAAYGPGLKRKLVEINIDVSDDDNPIGAAIRNHEPVVVSLGEDTGDQESLRRIFSRLDIEEVVLFPLVSAGQAVGVLAVQPHDDGETLSEEGIALLRSLASEIATVLLAKRFEERVTEGDKMRTAGLLAAGIAHNFNNLLQAILGQASLLEMQVANPEKVERAAKLIHDAATRGAGLVKQLMSFAQLEQPRLESTDCNYLLETAIRTAKEINKDAPKASLSLGAELPRVWVDPGQICQVMQNIILNAFEATDPSLGITIESEAMRVDERTPHYEVPSGEYIRVSIRDQGEGMDEETRKRCLEPFFTTKNVDPVSGLGMSGTGLGLAAAYALTRRNGGNLIVESRPGSGTVVTMYLPTAAAQEERADVNSEDDSSPEPSSSTRVLATASVTATSETGSELHAVSSTGSKRARAGDTQASNKPISLAEHLKRKRAHARGVRKDEKKGTSRVLQKPDEPEAS